MILNRIKLECVVILTKYIDTTVSLIFQLKTLIQNNMALVNIIILFLASNDWCLM